MTDLDIVIKAAENARDALETSDPTVNLVRSVLNVFITQMILIESQERPR